MGEIAARPRRSAGKAGRKPAGGLDGDPETAETGFRVLLESARDAIIIVDRRGKIVMANAQTEAVFGYDRRELLGMTIEDLIAKAHRLEHVRHRRRLLASPRPRPMVGGLELSGLRRDGTEFPTEISLSPSGSGKGALVTAVVRDTTERKRQEDIIRQLERQVEEELRESEVRFRTTLDDLKEGFQVISFDWRYLFVNDAVAVHGRRAKEDLLGKTVMECYPGIEETEVFAQLRRCMEQRVSHRMETEFVFPDGSSAWFELDIQPVTDGICVLTLDISDRKRTEDELLQRQEWLSIVLAGIGDAVVATDADGIVQFLNPAAEALTAWNQEDAVGCSLAEVFQLLNEDTGLPIEDPVASVIAAGDVVRIGQPCLLVDKGGGRRPVEDSAAPIRDSSGSIIGVVLVLHDISLQKHTADELRRLTTRLLEAQEDERRQVAYDIHDGLGQLITAASMHLETFLANRAPTQGAVIEEQLAKTRRCLQDAVVEMRRMVSYLGPLLLEDLGLGEACHRLMLDLAERCGWEAEFEGDMGERDLHPTLQTAVYRIVQEALSNVAKHADASRVRLSCREDEDRLIIEVRDWGRGFRLPTLPQPGERGYSVGLLGMRERAGLIGGNVTIESEPGEGTTVTISVPVAPTAAIAAEGTRAEGTGMEEEEMEEPKRGRETARETITVAIADDHPMVREGLRSMLQEDGIEIVGEAVNGAEAVDLVRRTKPNLVLMDVRMPDMDGLAATEIIKQESPETSIIVITSYESKDYLRRAIEAGAAGYLLKGMARDSLIDGIRLVRGGGSLIDARLLSELLSDMGVEGTRFQGAEGTLEALTPREQEVLQLLVRGLTNKQIAAQMHYSVGTVKNVVQRVIEKLGVSDRTQAAVYAVRAGIAAAV
jgi:PAS domain S-box-containing protein